MASLAMLAMPACPHAGQLVRVGPLYSLKTSNSMCNPRHHLSAQQSGDLRVPPKEPGEPVVPGCMNCACNLEPEPRHGAEEGPWTADVQPSTGAAPTLRRQCGRRRRNRNPCGTGSSGGGRRDWLQRLHETSPETVPHLLPGRAQLGEMVAGLPLRVVSFMDEPELYLAVLEVRAPLPSPPGHSFWAGGKKS